MKKLSKYFSSSKGFTLVELLVVIGVLGILAAGLLATIDPLEQFRKGIDNNRRQSAVELVNALQRYYASYQKFPWIIDANITSTNTIDAYKGPTSYLGSLISAGELKPTYTTDTALLSALWLNYTNGVITVCFLPTSKSFKADSAVTSNNAGSAIGASSASYWCAQ